MSEIKIINLSNTCRVCLQQDSKTMTSIFEDDSNNLADVISCLADVKIDPKDGLPDAICFNCKRKVEEFDRFKNLIKLSDKTLRSYLKINDGNNSELCINQDNIFTDNSDSPITYIVTMPNDSTQIWDTADSFELKKNVDEETEGDSDVKMEYLYETEEDCGDNNNEISVSKCRKNIDIYCQLCSKKFSSLKELKKHVIEHCLLSETRNATSENLIKQVREEDVNSSEEQESPQLSLSPLTKTSNSTEDKLNNESITQSSIITKKVSENPRVKKTNKKKNGPHPQRRYPIVRNKLDRIIDEGGICLGFKFKDNYFESVVLCKYCSQELTTDMINDHASECSIKNRNLICEECGKQFNLFTELKNHKTTHSSKPLTCVHCNINFSNISTYNTHMKRHTLGSRFNCETCGKKFFSNSELIRHVQKHLNNKQYTCNCCDASFVTRPELTRHLKYHSGLKKFQCYICMKTYYESGHLKVHMRCHTGEKPFVCQTCNKAFITKSKLKRHEKIHSPKTD
ncbi:zinc finger protein 33A [Microplitis demolitor]|uniref:zinc finger protein 33A n=1 Tax=Microplitis demolitor TaxID=69319 RepID=UPI0004CD3ADB|nr:zinc finger protein 33A [Microplitis demolitor]